MARKNKGRKKLEMVKIPNDSNLQVTFSKRRSGLFKKASELCTLCGAEVAVIVFSPSKKVFSFGNPSVESVVDRFVNRNPLQTSYTIQLFEAHRNANGCELNMQLTEVLNQLEAEKKRGEELTKIRKASQCQCWWEAPIEELSPSQLEQLKVSLEDLKKNVTQQVEEVMFQSSAALRYHPGSSSTGGIVPFDPNNTGFNPSNMNMMPHPLPPLPPPHQPHQPLPFPSSPHHPHPHPSHGFNPGFGSGFC